MERMLELGERMDSRESSATLVGNTPEPQASRGTKRDRDDGDDELLELAPQPKKPAIFINLVDDD